MFSSRTAAPSQGPSGHGDDFAQHFHGVLGRTFTREERVKRPRKHLARRPLRAERELSREHLPTRTTLMRLLRPLRALDARLQFRVEQLRLDSLRGNLVNLRIEHHRI